MLVARGQDQRIRAAHLLVQQTDGIVLPIVRTERVRADKLREAIRLVRVGSALGPHLVQHDGNARARDLVRGFRSGEAGADDVDGSGFGHMHRTSTACESLRCVAV